VSALLRGNGQDYSAIAELLVIMAAVRHLGFLKLNFLTVSVVKTPILHQHTKFRKDRSNRCGDIAIFVIFKMAAAAMLDFQNLEILTVDSL